MVARKGGSVVAQEQAENGVTRKKKAAHRTRHPRRKPSARAFLRWWWSATVPQLGAAEAERRGRAHGASSLLLGMIGAMLLAGLLWIGLMALGYVPIEYTVLGGWMLGLTICEGAVLFLRRNHLAIAGILVVAASLASGLLAILMRGPLLDTASVSLLMVLLVPVIVAFVFLRPVAGLAVAALVVALMPLILFAMPWSGSLQELIVLPGGWALALLPEVSGLLLGIFGYLWSRSISRGYERATRATLEAEAYWGHLPLLLDTVRESTERIEVTLKQVAEGKSDMRIPQVRDAALARIASRINSLLDERQRPAQSLSREQVAILHRRAHQIAVRLVALREGTIPDWPAPDGSPLDEIIQALADWRPSAQRAGANLHTDIPSAHESAALREQLQAAYASGQREFYDLHLVGADLSDMDLPGVELVRANLVGVSLSDVDFTGSCLREAVLIRADLSGAHLANAELADANLTGAQLGTADLSGADCSGAVLDGVNLTGADLQNANLTHARLERAEMHKAELTGADLSGALLLYARLHRATLIAANLEQAVMIGAHVTFAVLTMANLRGADLTDADLHGADLSDADLRGANLTGADLTGGNLSGANLDGAILAGADLTDAVLDIGGNGSLTSRGASVESAL